MKYLLAFLLLLISGVALADGCTDKIGEYRPKYSSNPKELVALDQLEAICHKYPGEYFGAIQNALDVANPQYALKMIENDLDKFLRVEANKQAPQ